MYGLSQEEVSDITANLMIYVINAVIFLFSLTRTAVFKIKPNRTDSELPLSYFLKADVKLNWN